MRYLPIIAVALAAATACGGSGGTSRNDYVKSLNQAEASLQTSLSSIGNIGGSTSAADVAKTLDAGGTAMDKAADNFNKITPPSDAKDAHAKIVDGLHKIAGTFHTAAKDANGSDLTKVLTEVQGITDGDGAKEIQAAQDELVKNGYKVND
jgi:hypothetical protein